MKIFAQRILETNYTYIIEIDKGAILVDPGEFGPIRNYLEKNQLRVVATLLTHKHWDHTQGVEALVQYQDHPVYGGSEELFSCPVVKLQDMQVIDIAGESIQCIHLPGHTMGACGYLLNDCLFTGDVLFGGGMGRIFEGSAEDMLDSLDKISLLDDQVKIYFGHEYTKANLEFALTAEPSNQNIQERIARLSAITTPSDLALEKATNPFLRIDEEGLREQIKQYAKQDINGRAMYLQALRAWKNAYDEGRA